MDIAIAGTSTNLKILASGFNGFGQLGEERDYDRDVRAFVPLRLPPDFDRMKRLQILHAAWSDVYMLADNHFFNLNEVHETRQCLPDEVAQTITLGFGDHNALYGCTSAADDLYAFDSKSDRLVRKGSIESPKVSHVAVAGTGQVAVAVAGTQSLWSNIWLILQFQNVDDMCAWFHNPVPISAADDRGRKQFSIAGRPKQLLANKATWLLLTDEGHVWSWGDPRHASLGRDITVVDPGIPGWIETLDGLRIVKIAAGGWMGAALTDGGEVYLWGRGEPGTDATVDPLIDVMPNELVMLRIYLSNECNKTVRDGAKFLDIGIGSNHLAAIVEGGLLFVCGENENGQLGLGKMEDEGKVSAPAFLSGWNMVDGISNAKHVVCAERSTFVLVPSSPRQQQRTEQVEEAESSSAPQRREM